MLLKMKCPQCGADMDFDDSRDFMFCAYCGARIANIVEERNININQNINVNGSVVYSRDTSTDPNLIIEYSTTNPVYGLVTFVNGEKWGYANMSSKTYRLNPGMYIIKFVLGRRRWDRRVYIPMDNTPVKVNVVFSGHTNIYIEQPPQGIAEWNVIEEQRQREEMARQQEIEEKQRQEALKRQQEIAQHKEAKMKMRAEKKAARLEKKAAKAEIKAANKSK